MNACLPRIGQGWTTTAKSGMSTDRGKMVSSFTKSLGNIASVADKTLFQYVMWKIFII
jgi:hypothetical protein